MFLFLVEIAFSIVFLLGMVLISTDLRKGCVSQLIKKIQNRKSTLLMGPRKIRGGQRSIEHIKMLGSSISECGLKERRGGELKIVPLLQSMYIILEAFL